jgi:transmembrane sensor
VDENRPEGSTFDDELGELELLVDYLDGTATPGERETLEERMRADPALRRRVEQTRLLWERSGTTFQVGDPDAAVEALAARVRKSIDAGAVGASQPVASDATVVNWRPRSMAQSRPNRLATVWSRGLIAASILLVTAIGFWRAGLLGPRVESATRPEDAPAVMEFATGPGERRTLSLADGTRVTLAPGSVLRTARPPYTGTGSRDVHLQGHAYFEVTPDPDRPFLVRTPRAVTRVLGTEFDVRAYAGSTATEVLVRSGRVALSASSDSVAEPRILTGGDRGTVAESGDIRVENGVDTSAGLAWTAGTLIFRAAPVPEVVTELERWYGLRIRLADPAMRERRITATFANEPVDLVLQTMAELLGADWKRADGEVIFSLR